MLSVENFLRGVRLTVPYLIKPMPLALLISSSLQLRQYWFCAQ